MNDFTIDEQDELEKAHDDGCCNSCGWHAGFYEMDYDPTGRIIDGLKEWWDTCKSENEDSSNHRGCYIYTRITNE